MTQEKYKELMEKILGLHCPYCKADLKKVGYRTIETISGIFQWNWNERKKCFKCKEGKYEDEDRVIPPGSSKAFCGNCNKEISDLIEQNTAPRRKMF